MAPDTPVESPVRLLFDENLAAQLVKDVAALYPGSEHVETLGLLGASDRMVWQGAAAGGFLLVTKDADFHRMSTLLGPPPKVVWIRLGNCATADVAKLLVMEVERIRQFAEDADLAFLALGL